MSNESHPHLYTRPNTLVFIYVQTRDADGNKIVLSEQNIAEYVTFGDTSGDSTNDRAGGGHVSIYETQVKSGGTVTWFGAVKNIDVERRDFVIVNDITDISPAGNLSNPIGGPTGNDDKSFMTARITGRPSQNPIQYTIHFAVWWVDSENGTYENQGFSIDPKLRIH